MYGVITTVSARKQNLKINCQNMPETWDRKSEIAIAYSMALLKVTSIP